MENVKNEVTDSRSLGQSAVPPTEGAP